MNPYESKICLGEYLLFHYGKPAEIFPFNFAPSKAMDFHRRVISEMVRPFLKKRQSSKKTRGLDLGCAVGRLSFELSTLLDEVVGIDFSRTFISAAKKLLKNGSVSFEIKEEGNITEPKTVALEKRFHGKSVRFEVGDAQNLRPGLGQFEVMVLANLIDRLPDPRKCLRQLPRLLKPGGLLVIASPYTWLEEYTPPRNQLGGLVKPVKGRAFDWRGKPLRTLDGLKKILSRDFRLLKKRDLPFLIREHQRKYQFVIAEATCWCRK